MNITEKIAAELNIKISQVENTIKLIDDGNTIPFIARYRKEVTGNLSDETLREFGERLTYLRNLEERKEEVIRLIDEQGKLTDELKQSIEKAEILSELEDIYRPYKQKKRTRATIAKEKGLEPLATIIYLQSDKRDLCEIAKDYIAPEKGVETIDDALNGAKDIIAEQISDEAEYRKRMKILCQKEAVIVTKAAKEEKSPYEMYYEFSETIKTLPSHRILAINRGEKEEFLKVKIDKPDEKIIDFIKNDIIKDKTSKYNTILTEIVEDSYKRLIEPSVDRELRADLTEKAEEKAIKVFGKNAKQLLLQAPIKNITVLGFDPAYRTGCKLAVIDQNGKLLDTATVYPTEPQNDVAGAEKVINNFIKKYDINITQEEILKEADGAVVRPHIVSAILKKYQDSIYTKDYLYEHYLGDNKPCFVPVNKTNTKDAIELLHRNNCIAIIAHPLYTDGLNFQDLLSLNIDGVECFYKYRFQTDNTVLKFAEQNNLLVTGGSDYHGPNIRDSMNEAYLEGEYVNKFLKRLNR